MRVGTKSSSETDSEWKELVIKKKAEGRSYPAFCNGTERNTEPKCKVPRQSDPTHPIVYPDSSDSSASNSKSGDDKLEPRSLVRNNDNYFFKENSAYNDEDKNVVNEERKEDKNNNAVNV